MSDRRFKRRLIGGKTGAFPQHLDFGIIIIHYSFAVFAHLGKSFVNDIKNEETSSKRPPVVFVHSALVLELCCPGCDNKSNVTLQKPLTKSARVTCNKCNTVFMVQPSQRQAYRKPIDTYGELGRTAPEGVRSRGAVDVKIVDVSQNGLGVVVSKRVLRENNFEIGETLFVRFELPVRKGGSVVNAQGKVRNIIPQGDGGNFKIGLELEDLDEHARKAIGFYLWN